MEGKACGFHFRTEVSSGIEATILYQLEIIIILSSTFSTWYSQWGRGIFQWAWSFEETDIYWHVRKNCRRYYWNRRAGTGIKPSIPKWHFGGIGRPHGGNMLHVFYPLRLRRYSEGIGQKWQAGRRKWNLAPVGYWASDPWPWRLKCWPLYCLTSHLFNR